MPDRRAAAAAAVQLLCVRVRVIVHLNVNVRCVHDGHDLSARLLTEMLGRAAEGRRVQCGRHSRRQRVGWRIEWMRQRPQCRDLHDCCWLLAAGWEWLRCEQRFKNG